MPLKRGTIKPQVKAVKAVPERVRAKTAKTVYPETPARMRTAAMAARAVKGRDPMEGPVGPEEMEEVVIPASLLPSDAKEGDLLIGSLRVDRRRTKQAKADLAANRAVIYISGKVPPDAAFLDEQTGLLKVSRGCCISEREGYWIRGYNQTVRQYVREHGLPPNSLKRKLLGLDRLLEFLNSTKPIELRGPKGEIADPTGRYKLVWTNDSKRIELAVVDADGKKHFLEGQLLLMGPVRVAWGPDPTSMILQVLEGRNCHILLYDLSTVAPIQRFTVPVE